MNCVKSLYSRCMWCLKELHLFAYQKVISNKTKPPTIINSLEVKKNETFHLAEYQNHVIKQLKPLLPCGSTRVKRNHSKLSQEASRTPSCQLTASTWLNQLVTWSPQPNAHSGNSEIFDSKNLFLPFQDHQLNWINKSTISVSSCAW